MKQKLIFITKIYIKESYFYAEDKNFNLKPKKNVEGGGGRSDQGCVSQTMVASFVFTNRVQWK